jgi:hypothetical protein
METNSFQTVDKNYVQNIKGRVLDTSTATNFSSEGRPENLLTNFYI